MIGSYWILFNMFNGLFDGNKARDASSLEACSEKHALSPQ